jgi:hypothetical protein
VGDPIGHQIRDVRTQDQGVDQQYGDREALLDARAVTLEPGLALLPADLPEDSSHLDPGPTQDQCAPVTYFLIRMFSGLS